MNIAIAQAAFKTARALLDYDWGLGLDIGTATDEELSEFALYLRADLAVLTSRTAGQ